MQGANPETVGTIRQGTTSTAMAMKKMVEILWYCTGRLFYVSKERRKSKHNTVESIVCGIAYGI